MKKILIVEDQDCFLRLYAMWLRRNFASVRVDFLISDLMLVEKIFSEKYDLIIMDINLGFGSGLKITRQLRNSGYIGAIVAATGDHSICENMNGEKVFHAVLRKAFKEEEFVQTLSRFL